MSIFGANWRTSVSGIGAAIFGLLTVVAALPYDLGTIANVFPPDWKAKVVTISAIATVLLKVWNSVVQKDKTVTGGSTMQTLSGDVASAGTQTMVDQTVVATMASNESVTPEQRAAVQATSFKLPPK